MYVANYVRSQQSVETGLTMLKYENYTTEAVTTTSEFSNGDISTDSLPTGDLAVANESGGELTLGHYGDSAPDTDKAQWWDDDSDTSTRYNWRYRKCFDVDNTAANTAELDEHQLYVSIDTATLVASGDMLANGNDMRFVDADGNIMHHTIADGMNTSDTRVWVKVNEQAAGESAVACMYYGYVGTASLTSVDNRAEVFTYSSPVPTYYSLSGLLAPGIATFASYTDNNNITVSTYDDTLDANEPDTHGLAGVLNETDAISTNAPLSGAYNAEGADNLVPVEAAGTEFVRRIDRGTNVISFVSPWCSATVNMTNSSGNAIAGSPFTIAAGSHLDVTTNNSATNGLNDNSVVIIEEVGSDCPILASHHSTSESDSFALYPAGNEWYGVGSGNLEIAAMEDNTSITVYRSTNTTSTYTLNRGQQLYIADAGSQGSDPAHRVVSDKPIGVGSLADGDGSEGTTFLPRRSMGMEYRIADTSSDYVSVATVEGVTTKVDLYNDGSQCGVGTPDRTQTVNPANNNPGKVHFTGGTIPQGACVVADNPIFVYNEYTGTGDEHNVWSYKQNQRFVHPQPSQTTATVETGSWSLGTGATFSRRLPITVTNNQTSDSLDEYQIYFDMNAGGFSDVFANAQSDAGDIRFAGAAGDGSDSLDYWLETYNSSANEGHVWFQADSVAAGSSKTFYLYYDATATQTTTASQESVFTTTGRYPNYYIVDSMAAAVGAVSLAIFEDGTEVDAYGADNAGDVVSYPHPSGVSNGDAFSVEGPISGDFAVDGTDSIAPIGFAGTRFSMNAYRETDTFSVVAPYANANITLQQATSSGWSNVHTATVPAGTTSSFTRDIPDGNAFRLLSDEKVIVAHGSTSKYDSQILYPEGQAYNAVGGQYELYGVESNYVMLSTSSDTPVNVTVYESNGSSYGVTLNSSNQFAYISPSGGNQGTGPALRIVADGLVSAASAADSDGGESAVFWPRKELSNHYVLPSPTQYVTFSTPYANNTCRLFDENGTEITSNPGGFNAVPPQVSGTRTSPYPNKIFIGGSDSNDGALMQAGYSVLCDKPAYMYAEHHTSAIQSDETSVMSWYQARQQNRVEPTVGDIDAATEEGLYVQSGVYEYTLDSTNAHTFWSEMISTFNENSPQTTTNSTTPFAIEWATSQSGPCDTATYGTYQPTPFSATISLPDAASDNQCLRVRIVLATGNESYTPELEQFSLVYSTPSVLEDIHESSSVSIKPHTGSTSRKQRALKIVTSDPGFDNSSLGLDFIGVSNESNFTTANVSLYNIASASTVNQYSLAFPASGTNASQSIAFDRNNSVAVYLDHKETSATSTSVIDLASNVWLRRPVGMTNQAPIIYRDFQLVIEP